MPTPKKEAAVAAVPDLAPFTWTAPSGAEIVLPLRSGQIKAGTLRKLRRMSSVDAIFTVLEEICDEKTLAQIDDLTADEFNQLAEAWQEDLEGDGAKIPEA